jgi:hypothetical protein
MEYLDWASRTLKLRTYKGIVMNYPDDDSHDTSHDWHQKELRKTLAWFHRHLLQ